MTATLRLVRPDNDFASALETEGFSAFHGENVVLSDVAVRIPRGGVTAIVGPSGAGKSTLLRAFNRMNADVAGYSESGALRLAGDDLSGLPDTELRARVGMVFQQPCVFPTTIFRNVVFGLQHKRLPKAELRERAGQALRRVGLWDEVRSRLDRSADELSLGQKQRLCIARALAVEPDVLLMDEPTASIDPRSVKVVEALIRELAGEYTVVIVTHDIRQARRVSDTLAFLCEGELVECGPTAELFARARDERTRGYLTEAVCDC